MLSKRVKYILLGLVALLVGYIIYDASEEPGIDDLKGTYQEVAMYRNENNTGPIIRIYAVTVSDTTRWDEMQQYGDLMLYTKYGNTKVYFFPAGKPAPLELFPKQPNFDRQFEPYCLAVYEKDAMSQVSFRKKPFATTP
ncbi:hypothetical protein ACFQ4C_10910 [Larkinella insperata]|uniref:Uncharacterized protein n=1 Tax=Larkinella insperata TaxID=332158 RepID=A0ABW3Q2G3_9BACT|nr:hypothetical protein [Larkinella insperata]